MNDLLIGLVGLKGAGKDTLASLLSAAHRYQRSAWADALKREVYDAFGRLILRDLGLEETFAAWMTFVDAHKYDPPLSAHGWLRPLLQFWGTEYRRVLCGEDYWVSQMRLRPGMIVTDCRFPNEIAAIRAAGGQIWCVTRPSLTGADTHASETAWRGITPDAVISNDREPAHMLAQAEALLASTQRAVCR